jgi:methyl-accepting chemotaxis protein
MTMSSISPTNTQQVSWVSDHATALERIRKKSDTILGYTLWIYFGFGIVLSFFYDTYSIAFGVGGLCLIAYFVTKSVLQNNDLYQYVGSAVLAVFMAQFIYQMHGMAEMHFFVFVGSLLLITYQNWKLQLPLAAIVVVHHSLFAWLQYSGNKAIYFTQQEYMDLTTFLFHAGLAAVIFAISGYWSYDLAKNTLHAAKAGEYMSNQLQNVQSNIAFAEEISKGNLAYQYSVQESDELGLSLVTMRESLLVANKREQEEKFISLGLNKVGEILRSHTDNIEQLADALIRGLVKYLEINQGAMFVVEGEAPNQELVMKACYAYDRKKYLEKRISIHEGLVGQCYLEQDVIYLTEVPREYIRITSGLGDAPPNAVLLMPLKTNDETVGVIELASFTPFSDNHMDFLRKACQNIASAIISAHTTERIKALLEESQIQAEEMRAQEEEMRQNMEELSATQEAMEAERINLQGLVTAVNSSVAMIEFETDGTITDANPVFLQIMEYDLNEIVGKHHAIFVDAEYRQSEEYAKFWRELSLGKTITGESVRYTKTGKEVWLQAAYSSVKDAHGRVLKVIKLATDITMVKRMQAEAQAQAEALRAQEEELRQNMEELQTTQEELEKSNKEIEEIRKLEKERADTQISSQKKIMEQFMARTKEKENTLLQKIQELEEKLVTAQNGSINTH